MVLSREKRNSPVALLALCGVAAPIVFGVVLAVAGIAYDGYSHVTQAVSELGGGGAQYPLIQNASFFVLGLLLVAFAFGLQRGIGDGGGSKVGPALVGAFGVSAGIGNAFFPCDPGCEFETLTGTMHNLTGLGGFIAGVAAIFLISRRLGGDASWRSFQRFSRLTGVAALVSLLLWIGVAKAAEIDAVNGLLQRLYIGVWFLWIEVMALRLFWISRGHSVVVRTAPSQDRIETLETSLDNIK